MWTYFFRFSSRYERYILFGIVILTTVLFSSLSVIHHERYESGAFDLGIYDQAVYRYAHFLPNYNTVKERNQLGDHLTLTLPVISSLFSVWEDTRLLLILQSFVIALSFIPAFFLVKRRLKSSFIAYLVSLVYLFFYGIQFGVFFDFHPVILGVSLLLFLTYAIEMKNKLLIVCFTILTLLTQENMGIALAGLAAIYFFRSGYRKVSIVLAGTGILYSFVAMKTIAAFSPVGFQYAPEIPATINIFFSRLFDAEEKKQVFLYSFGWFSFLPLFSPGALIAVVMDLSQYFVTGPAFSQMWTPFKHHRAILSVFLLLGTLDVLGILRRIRVNLVVIGIILFFSACVQQYLFHFPLNKLTKKEFVVREAWTRDADRLLSSIPPSYAVATQQNFVPHIAHRKDIYLIWPRMRDMEEAPCGRKTCWWLEFGGNPEYLIVDTRPDQWLTQILESNEHWQEAITSMETMGVIEFVRNEGAVKLYKIHTR